MDREHEIKEPVSDVVETVAPEPPEDSDDEALLEYFSYREKQAKLESARWAGYSEHQPAMQILDLLQESTTILRKYNVILLILGLCLAVPLSAILLSHVLLRLPFMDHWVKTVQFAAEQRFKQHSHRAGYRRLAEILMSNMVDIPFSALFSPLLKAGVAYVVAATYSRKRLELEEVVDVLQRIWLLLMQTFMWTCAVFLAFAAAFASLLWFASHTGSIFGMTTFIVATMVGLVLAAGLAYANVMCNLAYVVTALEGSHGRPALVHSINLLKGRFEVALLLFLVTNVNATLLDVLFEFHIIRNTNPSAAHDKYWEAPLLVCMHSFVYLFDAIMVSVLYYLCKSSDSDNRSAPHAVEDQASTSELAEEKSPLVG
ncbi:uncharacterized protein [Physcomitrium patens]|uniref:Uncharacterized protein n=1 Tax=Physcomitrium patens TaxID=3218 RepID=A9RY53_PHYPA|nr:uncharacterized protein LOC112285960 [Physcomitrium patens]PNR49182.1 hypothetical protein PHYPA_011078 [Physcomitrium patens]|eukprot:XP_024383153.1 uncharacterized protein LOC112285960 [Physcomitrella patens]